LIIFLVFEAHYILAEKQQTQTTNSSSLNFFTSLDTHDTLREGIIVEWETLWPKNLVWAIHLITAQASKEGILNVPKLKRS
jgi:predicted RNA-binding protein with PIN domain